MNSLADDRSGVEQPQVETAADSVKLDEGAPDEGRMSGGEADTPPEGSSKAVGKTDFLAAIKEKYGDIYKRFTEMIERGETPPIASLSDLESRAWYLINESKMT